MTAQTLRELVEKATEESPTPELWESVQLMNDGREDQYYLNDATDSLVFIEHRSGIPVTSKHRAELIAYLRNHCSDFIKLMEAAEKRTHHYECEDPWYSCPKSENGCADDRMGPECTCGADEMREALAAFKEKS